MSAISEKERDRLYGQLIMDFINAKDPEGIFLSLISSIQRVFDFPPCFTEAMLWRYPIQEFNKVDKTLFKAFQKSLPPCFRETKARADSIYSGFRRRAESIERLKRELLDEGYNTYNEEVIHYWIIKKQRRVLDEILEEYHVNIRILLEQFIDEKSLYKNDWFRNWFIDFFNRSKISGKSQLCLRENCSIYEQTLFRIELFYDYNSDPPRNPFRQALAYCLAHFLKPPTNRALIRKCEECQKYFIASKLDKRIKKCKECSAISTKSKEWKMEYMRGYRKKKKIQKEKQGIERKVENYMRNLDITREEALAIIKADSML